MKIHKEGYNLILFFFLFFATIVTIIYLFSPDITPIDWLIYLACLGFFLFVVSFFRMPKRVLTPRPGSIVSPADGKIVVIEKVFEEKYFKEDRMQVSIFMSPFNVHVNWFPINAKVEYYEYHPGKYLVAWHPKSSDANERTTVVLTNEKKQRILVRQIAGAVARRIHCNAKEGQEFKQGQELGFIRFGSRVDLFLPIDTKITVDKNQIVKGLETVIGYFPE
ncbi:MAG: phosphatidylserine decarboxylase family protein [Bacteroidota bacterium]